jgi:iron complex transport system substrate-binding protein
MRIFAPIGPGKGMIALMIALIGGATLWAAATRPPANAGKRPQRIVSLNLCADQLLVALADRDQIAGLTHNAPDRQMSAVAAATRGLPILNGSAEQILATNPDLVIGMPARRNPAIAILKAQHYPAVDLKSADSYADIVASIRTVAQAIGHADRGEAMIARMDRELAALPRAPRQKVAAYYQRRGYMTGTGTLVDDLMTRAGLRNLAADLGKPAIAQVSLEEMVAARPDYLIVESATDRITDQGTEMLHHPVLRDIPRISLPQAWTVCGGPAYVQAARALSQAVSTR